MIAEPQRPWSLGIDFGTTTTAAAICDVGEAITGLAMPDGSATMPSSVLAEGGWLLVGRDADDRAPRHPDRYEPSSERHVDESRVQLGDNEFEPFELIQAVLADVVLEAYRQRELFTLRSVIMIHPLAWAPRRQRVVADALKNAVQMVAGDVGRHVAPVFVPEPLGAADWLGR